MLKGDFIRENMFQLIIIIDTLLLKDMSRSRTNTKTQVV